ncbi:MAG: glycosyltransferase [Mucilaginibacter sp.]|uniref:XrtY-associated glycosyltransferase XYAG1 n=1 Tax=Mucilaginibacter sp. TaxID=1882438 RepID=UPI0031B0540F
MKILQISASYKPAFIYGGPTMSVSMLSEQLAQTGISISVFTTTANGQHELEVQPNTSMLVDGIEVSYFKRITKDHSHFSPLLLKAVWKNAKTYDLVHIHAWWNLVSILSCLIALICRVPVLVSPRGTLSSYSFSNRNTGIKAIIHRFLGKPILKRCHIHTTSKREDDTIAHLISPKSISTISNFVKLPVIPLSESGLPSPTLKLIFFSRIEEKKGLDILINALALVNIPFSLTIAGDGNRDYIKSLQILADKKRISDKITWVGFIQENKFDVLRQHDLFILPSYDENFGNVVIESLAVGTPVLVSEGVGLADYVIQNQLGWTCKTNEASVAQAINQIAGQSDKFTYIRQNAPQAIARDFGNQNLVKKYKDLYNKIILSN